MVQHASDVPCGCAGNMVLFDSDGKIKRYETAEAILEEFFHLRLDYYARRRSALIKVSLTTVGQDHLCMLEI